MGVVLLMVMLAVAVVGLVMVREFIATPSPKLAMVTPCWKLVSTAVMATFSVWPWVPKVGLIDAIACPGASELLNAEIGDAVSVFPSPSGDLTAILHAPNVVPLS